MAANARAKEPLATKIVSFFMASPCVDTPRRYKLNGVPIGSVEWGHKKAGAGVCANALAGKWA
jgi:hypothetical protein